MSRRVLSLGSVVYHGTTSASLASILRGGLIRMSNSNLISSPISSSSLSSNNVSGSVNVSAYGGFVSPLKAVNVTREWRKALAHATSTAAKMSHAAVPVVLKLKLEERIRYACDPDFFLLGQGRIKMLCETAGLPVTPPSIQTLCETALFNDDTLARYSLRLGSLALLPDSGYISPSSILSVHLPSLSSDGTMLDNDLYYCALSAATHSFMLIGREEQRKYLGSKLREKNEADDVALSKEYNMHVHGESALQVHLSSLPSFQASMFRTKLSNVIGDIIKTTDIMRQFTAMAARDEVSLSSSSSSSSSSLNSANSSSNDDHNSSSGRDTSGNNGPDRESMRAALLTRLVMEAMSERTGVNCFETAKALAEQYKNTKRTG